MVSTPLFSLFLFAFFSQSALPCLFVTLEISITDIDDVLLSAPEFHLPLAIDRFGKEVPQTTGGQEERERGEAEEPRATASSQSLLNDRES